MALRQVEGKAAPAAAALEGERILIAAGSAEKLFPGMKVGDGVVTSKEALVLDTMPASVVVIGAGAIGLEFGYFYSAFGAKVTIVELEKQMLPGFDAEVAEELRRAFVKRGITVMLGHGYKSMARKGELWSVTVNAEGAEKSVEAEVVLVAVGRTPLSMNFGLEKLGVELERGGFIKMNDSFQTSVPSIYSIGDVIRPPLLAHKASSRGNRGGGNNGGRARARLRPARDSGMYLLRAGSRDRRAERGGGKGARYRGEGRQDSVSRDGQGGCDWRDCGLRENRRDQAVRRSDRMPDYRTRRD